MKKINFKEERGENHPKESEGNAELISTRTPPITKCSGRKQILELLRGHLLQ